jgi:thioredoxin reductase (NADPH)
MTQEHIRLFGAPWCPDCKRSKQFLNEQRIPYQWHDIDEDEEARAYVQQVNNGKQIIPTIVFPDGSMLVEPSNAELADKLGIHRRAKRTYYDLIIVGAGPAGLTAGLYAAREGINTLIIDRSGVGGQAGITQESRTTRASRNPSAALNWQSGCAARPSALRWRFWALKR